MKKYLAIILSLAIILCTLPLSALTASAETTNYTGSCGENVTYSFDESTGTLTISGSGDINDYSFGNYSHWYSYRGLIKTVVISDGVTSIGDYAFYYCTSLTEVTIGNGVTSIGDYAFYNCTSLTEVTIGNGVTSIGWSAFYYCTSLDEITIPNSVTSIGSSAFSFCTSLAEITIPNSVTSIGSDAFFGCYSLAEITIPDSVTSIGYQAFSCCYSLTDITIPDSVTSIGHGEFYNCTSLAEITIPDSVTSIGAAAFYNCTSLTSIIIPDSVTSIGNGAFEDCTSLTSIIIPDGVTSIGDSAFYGCDSLTSITIPDGVTSIGDRAFYSCDSLTSITIPDSVASIGDRAFCDCYSLTEITIPDSVTSIGSSAFSDCDSLTSITIPDSVKGVGDGVFSFCDSLAEVIIGNGVTSIGDGAFELCHRITSITIPDSVTSIGYSAFYYCSSLTSIAIPDSVTSIGDRAFIYCTNLTSIAIPDSVTRIGPCAFSNCTSLTKVTIGNGVTSIGAAAFEYCTSIKSIVVQNGNAKYHSVNNCLIETATKTLIFGCKNSIIPNDGSVTRIGNYAFQGCTSLTEITIPDSVTSIGGSAFSGCASLTEITIPDSVTSIASSAFYNTAYYNDGNNWENDVLYIGNHLIKAKTTISGSYTIKSGTKAIANSAFAGCTYLLSITIPDSVTSIDDYAFYDCGNLTLCVHENSYAHRFAEENNLKYKLYTNKPSAAPILTSKTDTTVTLVKIDGYEYSKDGNTWQTSNVFTGLSPNVQYTFYQRVAETETHCASDISGELKVTTYKTTITKPSKPTLSTKTDTTVALVAVNGYEYSKDGTVWQTSNVFAGLSPNTEYIFYQRVAETVTNYVSVSSDGLKVTTDKSNIGKPSAPILSSKTDTTVTLVKISGYEYSKNGTVWQTSNVFTGLSPNKEYTFYQRIAETETTYASDMSDALKVTTDKSIVSKPSKPTLSSKTDTTVTLVKISGYEYSKNCTTWQTSNVFTGLSPNTEYTFYQRIAETETAYASDMSDALKVTTDKSTVSKPAKPTLSSKTDTMVALVAVNGYEYSKDGITWQTSNVFDGLSPNTEYTFYQRVAETETNYASDISDELKVTTDKSTVSKPSKPTLSSKTDTMVALVAASGYEYSKDGNTWQTSNVFAGLSPNTEYNFYQRIIETETTYASDMSDALKVTTDKSTVSKPSKPTLSSKTDTTVVLVAVNGCEYSKDGTAWQTSNVFDGLSPNTEYTFYQRVAETETNYASDVSDGLKITTKQFSPKPAAPVIQSKTYSSVTLVPHKGYEYSIDGINWQSSNVFEELEFNVQYTFYQRVAETETICASDKSDGLSFVIIGGICGDNAKWYFDQEQSRLYIFGEGLIYTYEQRYPWFDIKDDIKYIEIDEGITNVPTKAFHNYKNLLAIYIPSTVKNMGMLAFGDCEALRDIYIVDMAAWCNIDFEHYSANPLDTGNSNVSSTPRNLYLNNGLITNVVIPKGVTTIKQYAFIGFEGMTSVKIPTSVISIGKEAFDYCNNLTKVYIEDIAAWCNIDFEGTAANPLFYGDECYNSNRKSLYLNDKLVIELVIPGNVSIIKPYAFYGCNDLRTVEISNGVTEIGNQAFGACPNLFTVNIPDTVIKITTPYNNSGTNATMLVGSHSYAYVFAINNKYIHFVKFNSPEKPTLVSYENGVVTLAAVSGYEYKMDNGKWQSSNVFVIADDKIDHLFYQRRVGDEEYYTSDPSEPLVLKPSGTVVVEGWHSDDVGIWYQNIDGSYLKNGWHKVENNWYHFDNRGYVAVGWKLISNKWYYFNAAGAMQTNWQLISNKWYFFNSSGAMVTGWLNDGKWYYFNASGAMQTAWQKIGGVWYYFNSSGAMQTGWQKIGNTWYYFNSSGAMQTGWEKISGVWYYFKSSGAMQTGWLKLGGVWYYFNTSGAMLANTSRNIGGKVYRFNASGACLNP